MKKYFNPTNAFFVLCLMWSCHFEDVSLNIKDIAISPKIAIPIGSEIYTVGEMISDLEDSSLSVVEGEDLSLSIYFSETTSFNELDEIINVQTINNQVDFSPGLNLPAGSPIDFEVDFSEEFLLLSQQREGK